MEALVIVLGFAVLIESYFLWRLLTMSNEVYEAMDQVIQSIEENELYHLFEFLYEPQPDGE